MMFKIMEGRLWLSKGIPGCYFEVQKFDISGHYYAAIFSCYDRDEMVDHETFGNLEAVLLWLEYRRDW
jgi:hypothetical protein